MSPISKNDWIEAGLEILAKEGPAALTIDRLTVALGMTKGSFYHHFDKYQDYQEKLLAFWKEQYTASVIAMSQIAQGPLQTLDLLIDSLLSRVVTPEVAIRVWGLQDNLVRRHVAEIDAQRLAYLEQLFAGLVAEEGQARFGPASV